MESVRLWRLWNFIPTVTEKTQIESRKSEVLVEVEIYIVILWVMAPYNMVRGYMNVFRVDNWCTISHRNVDITLPKYMRIKTQQLSLGIDWGSLLRESTCGQQHVNNTRLEKTAPLGAYIFVIFYTCYWGYQVKKTRKICDYIIQNVSSVTQPESRMFSSG